MRIKMRQTSELNALAHVLQDLVIPNFKEPNQIGESALLGFPALPRKTLLFFRGDFRDDGFIQRYSNTKYSGFVRQKLHYISRLYRSDKKYNILIGSRKEIPGDYNDHLLSSRFCLVLPGTWPCLYCPACGPLL
jgi:hypothetical protein